MPGTVGLNLTGLSLTTPGGVRREMGKELPTRAAGTPGRSRGSRGKEKEPTSQEGPTKSSKAKVGMRKTKTGAVTKEGTSRCWEAEASTK